MIRKLEAPILKKSVATVFKKWSKLKYKP